jgi:hypothetical protein
MTPPWIESLIDNPEQPIEDVMRTIYGHDVDPVLNALFDEGVRCQHSNPDRTAACARLIDRINGHVRLAGVGGMTSGG